MRKQTKVLRQILAAALIFGFASLALTGCDLFEKDEEGSNPTPAKKGNFNYTIIWPDNVTAELSLQRLPELTDIPLASVSTAKVNGKNRTLSQTLELDEGSYFFRALISNDNMYDGINEQIQVTAGKITVYEKTFTSDELVPTNPIDTVPITSADIVVIAPVKGAIPNITASGTGNFTIGTVSWSPSPERFLGGTVYTVRILLAANDGYTFTSLVSAKINGNDATVEYSNGSAALISYDFRTTEPVDFISNSFLATPSKDKIIYAYIYEGNYYYYIYLGQLANIPLYSFKTQIHDEIERDYSITVSEEVKNSVRDTVSKSVDNTISVITTDTVETTVGAKIGMELTASASYFFVSAEVKTSAEASVQVAITNSQSSSSGQTTSFGNTKEEASEYAKTTMETDTFHFTKELPTGYYRYTMFGISDVFLCAIIDPKNPNKDDRYFEFKEFIVEDKRSPYIWGFEYTKELPFGKKDSSSFIIDYEFIDDLPIPTIDLSPEDPSPLYTSVTVSPSSISIEKGKTQEFKAVVNGTINSIQTVTWTVTGGGSGTSISTSGLLTVASGETASSLTVRATSTAATSISGTASVTLTPAIPTFTSVSALGTWLSSQRENTTGTAYNVRLNTNSIANIQSTLRNNSKKYINLDFSGSTITEIVRDAFNGCQSLVRVTIPNSVKSIGIGGFYFCTNLASVDIGTGVVVIGYEAFRGCNFSSLTIPDNVSGIDQGAFYQNYNLTNVTLGTGITGISHYVFEHCSKLTSVTFKGTIPSKGFSDAAFYGLGDLRAKFYSTDSNVGKEGTYFRAGGSSTWYRQ